MTARKNNSKQGARVVAPVPSSFAPMPLSQWGACRASILPSSHLTHSFTSGSQDDDQCPVCKSDKYLTPNLKLLVSPCFHKMCESCIDRLFSAGPAPCPVCTTILRKIQFMSQIFEDLLVEKEVRERKKVAKIFNKRPEDFASLRAYNDYLEEVEEISTFCHFIWNLIHKYHEKKLSLRSWNLINGVDIDATQARVQRYEKENKEIIAANESKRANEDKYLSIQLELEKERKQQQREAYQRELEEEETAKKANEIEAIEELANSNKSAQSILAARQNTLKRSSAARQESATGAAPVQRPMISDLLAISLSQGDRRNEDEEMVDIDPIASPYEDPTPMYTVVNSYHDPVTDHLIDSRDKTDEQKKNIRGLRAGGYHPRFAYQRDLHEAYSGIFVAPS
ncbi:CDK-activating kinase assembly factor MAT1-domain-containing protein [Jimgerdemannia flammicorona]|uniref:RNA polymerase II transcription factor B subunit 3 n=1 Tax=Jimgerdemannia flammicorona TaxID=994334 RepID=A0A433R0J4_9FUNG|nr:CDK-activating kinase assembly factor MAT1-domain-containing protein [Jimgerdemannia flammicorona]